MSQKRNEKSNLSLYTALPSARANQAERGGYGDEVEENSAKLTVYICYKPEGNLD